jgi:nicotinamidase/pyrazinamidase
MTGPKKNTALLIVDMLNEYLAPKGKLYCAPCRVIIPNIKHLVGLARGREWPIIYVNTALDGSGYPLAAKWGMHARRGSWGAQVIPALKPAAGDFIVDKTTYDGFYETDLEEILRSNGVKTVVVTGIHTHVCVLLTALGAFYRGFKVMVLEECMTTDQPVNHATRLPFFKTHVGRLMKLEDFIRRNF